MTTLFVKFPPTDEAKAIAYEAECSEELHAAYPEETVWYVPRQDKNGNWTVALYGPPFKIGGVEVSEPPSCAALRVDAVVVETPEWQEEEDI